MKCKALVVDDDLIIRRLVASMLRNCVGQVFTASSGEQALALLEQHDFSLVITDLQMGQIDGLEVVRHAKKIQAGTKVIMMSGSGLQQSRMDAMRSGVDAYMEKPFSIDLLLEMIGIGKPALPSLFNRRCDVNHSLSA